MRGRLLVFGIVGLGLAPLALAQSSPPARDPGQRLYAANCAVCHGAVPNGKGPAARAIIPPPTDLTDPEYWKGLTDEELKKRLRVGAPGGSMPTFAHFGDSELTALIDWLRSQIVQPETPVEP